MAYLMGWGGQWESCGCFEREDGEDGRLEWHARRVVQNEPFLCNLLFFERAANLRCARSVVS